MPVLFQIGLLTVEAIGFNFDEFAHKVGADFAAKEIVGAPKPREFVGEADDTLEFSGKLFPFVLGGGNELEVAGQLTKSGDPQMVVRGDGVVYGWYYIESCERKHSTLNALGVGREIGVEMRLVKSPVAATADAMISTIFGLFG